MAARPLDAPGAVSDGGAGSEAPAGQGHRQPGPGKPAATRPGSILREELPAVTLLVVLYMLQGVPLGLSMGSM
jgi:hypothetical protein